MILRLMPAMFFRPNDALPWPRDGYKVGSVPPTEATAPPAPPDKAFMARADILDAVHRGELTRDVLRVFDEMINERSKLVLHDAFLQDKPPPDPKDDPYPTPVYGIRHDASAMYLMIKGPDGHWDDVACFAPVTEKLLEKIVRSLNGDSG